MEEYIDLVDQFYQSNENFMIEEQCTTAKQDVKYFMKLLDLAIGHSATRVQRG